MTGPDRSLQPLTLLFFYPDGVTQLGLGFHVLFLSDLKNKIGVRVVLRFFYPDLDLLKNRGSGTIVRSIDIHNHQIRVHVHHLE
jgi:hypothetical protein